MVNNKSKVKIIPIDIIKKKKKYDPIEKAKRKQLAKNSKNFCKNSSIIDSIRCNDSNQFKQNNLPQNVSSYLKPTHFLEV